MGMSGRWGMMTMGMIALLAACGGEPPNGTTGGGSAALPGPPDHVRLTWLSVTGWLLEAGETRVVLDGYVGRVDPAVVHTDGTSTARALPDEDMVGRVRDVLLAGGGPEWVLIGHGHWDHALDAPAWATAGGGRIVGARSVCWQAEALGVPADRCSSVEGGESFELGPGVSLRVVRWHHSGDSTTAAGRQLRAPLELAARPEAAEAGAAGAGLRPGFMEDYPNGGGSRAFLVTIETANGPIRVFWSNTGNPQLWDVAAPVDTAFFRENGLSWAGLRWASDTVPVRARLAEAVAAEGVATVDVWLGFGNSTHVRQVREVLDVRAFIPHHWDDFWAPLLDGVDRPFPGTSLPAYLADEGVAFHAPTQFLDVFRVDAAGVTALGDQGVRARLGVREPPGA